MVTVVAEQVLESMAAAYAVYVQVRVNGKLEYFKVTKGVAVEIVKRHGPECFEVTLFHSIIFLDPK